MFSRSFPLVRMSQNVKYSASNKKNQTLLKIYTPFFLWSHIPKPFLFSGLSFLAKIGRWSVILCRFTGAYIVYLAKNTEKSELKSHNTFCIYHLYDNNLSASFNNHIDSSWGNKLVIFWINAPKSFFLLIIS